MASKKYAYYNKGNKLAVIEKNTSEAHCSLSGYSNKTECESAGGTWYSSGSFAGSSARYGKYLSPAHSVDDGLELEYSYAPVYNKAGRGQLHTDYFRFLGYASNGTSLVLFTYGTTTTAVVDLSSKFAADDWILIGGKSRWAGLHQVASTGGSTGILTLKTPYKDLRLGANVDMSTSEIISAEDADNHRLLDGFRDQVSHLDTNYIIIQNSSNVHNDGLYEVQFIDGSQTMTIKAIKKYYFDGGDLSGFYNDWNSADASLNAVNDDAVVIYNAHYEELEVDKGIEVMEDETFDVDLNRYQSNAVVYYLKAKEAEDMRDMETREYFMRLFKKQVEKFSSKRKRGPNIIQGHWSINKIF